MNTVAALLVASATLAAQPDGMVLNFSATWCGPCRQMAPLVERLNQQNYPIYKVDIDKRPDLREKYGVDSFPTFILIVRGEEVARVSGIQTEADLRRMLARIPAKPEADAEVQLADAPKSRPQPQPFPKTAAASQPDDDPPLVPLPAFLRRDRGQEPAPVVRANNDEAPADVQYEQTGPMAASVRIRSRVNGHNNFGSGTVVESRPGRTLIVTCGHIFRGLDQESKIEVDVFTSGEKYQTYVGRVEKFDDEADVGLVSIPTDRPLPTVPVASTAAAPNTGDGAVNIGCSGGALPTREQVRVTARNKYEGPDNVECTGLPVQGRSGGGLFNEGDQLIGVCIAADPTSQRGLYAGLFAIHDLLDECDLAHLYRGSEPETQPALASSDAPFGASQAEMGAATSGQSLFADQAAAPAREDVSPFGGATAAPEHGGFAADAGQREAQPPGQQLAMAEEANPFASTESQAPSAAPPAQQPLRAAPVVNPDVSLEGDDAEVVCIIRSKNDPAAPSRVVIIDQASPRFMRYLNGETTTESPSSMAGPSAPPAEPAKASSRWPEGVTPVNHSNPATSSAPLWPTQSMKPAERATSPAFRPTSLTTPTPKRYVRSAHAR